MFFLFFIGSHFYQLDYFIFIGSHFHQIMQLFGIDSSPASFIRRKTFQVWSNPIRRHTYLLFHEFSFTTPKITLSLHTRFCISSLFPNAFFRGTVRRQQKVGLPSTGYNSPSVTVLRLICALVDHENFFIFSCLRCRHFNRGQGRSVY